MNVRSINGHRRLKLTLQNFWESVHGMDRAFRLSRLQELAGVVIEYHKQQPLNERREQFDEAKAKLHSFKVRKFGMCWVCTYARATARHHIVQLQNGGINSRKNVVSLCDACHAEIHPWLKVA